MSKQSHRTYKNRHSLRKETRVKSQEPTKNIEKEESRILHKSLKKQREIAEFCILIKSFYEKEIITIYTDEYYKNLIEGLPKEERKMVELLIHHLTKLNQRNRVIHKNRVVEIAEEDILTALEITGEIINPIGFITEKEQRYFYQLQTEFESEIFTRKQAQETIELRKSQTHRILNLLIEKGLLEKVKSFRNRGYKYKLRT